MPSPRLVLTTTLHDPQGGLAYLIDDRLQQATTHFSIRICVVTPTTDRALIDKIEQAGWIVVRLKKNEVGYTYYQALYAADKLKPDHALYIDFDRLVHWTHTHLEEWSRFCRAVSRSSYFVAERTKRAHQSHHEALYHTEVSANHVLSYLMGDGEHDYLAGCFAFDMKSLKAVVSLKCIFGYGLFAQYPLFLKLRRKIKPTYKRFEGLEWETPDRFKEELDRIGRDAWREQASTQAEWKRRALMTEGIIQAALRAYARF